MSRNNSLDLDALRARLESSHGPKYWRSLEEVAETAEFQTFLDDEFPNRTPDWNEPLNRRNVLRVMGASLALAGLTACTKQPAELIVPYVRQPEDIVPGNPLFYATAIPHYGVGTGVLVESHMGRPTKIEGNPDHPASLGACDMFGQASVLALYDPDRAQVVTHNGDIGTWGSFVAALTAAREVAGLKKGDGLRILSETITSPTLGDQIKKFLGDFPSAKWHQYDAAGRHNVYAGGMQAFAQPVNTIYNFAAADVILSLDSDFLLNLPGSLRYAREFIRKRDVAGNNTMNRLYVAECAPSITGGMADHRLRMRAGEVEAFAFAIARAVGVGASGGSSGVHGNAIAAIAKDLQDHKGSSIVITGDFQPPSVHALAHAINQALGNVGKTVLYTDPIAVTPVDQMQSLRDLTNDINSGNVETLLILGGNPVYGAPADVNFSAALDKVRLRAHLTLAENETSAHCTWVVPEAHYLESWSDIRAYDGTVSIVQPLIAPLYGAKSAHNVLSVLAGQGDHEPHDQVREYWQSQHKEADFEVFWQTALHNGSIPDTALPPKKLPAPTTPVASTQTANSAMEVVFRPDPTIGDGTWSNNGWLQETPKPQNKMTWDNAVWMSPATAQRLGVSPAKMDDLQSPRYNAPVVELQIDGRSVRGPVCIVPGHADNSVTVHLGYGRTRTGHVGENLGFNANSIRTTSHPWQAYGVAIAKTSETRQFAITQHTQTMEERDPFRVASLAEYQKDPKFAQIAEKVIPPELSLFPGEFAYNGYKWGMAIDLNSCIGCHACVVACQAENNIAVVGKEETAKGRHMNWLRVDRYYSGKLDDPELYFQPVPCMHCENAPCELVCPVAATVHSTEGLNQMVYNRCVGTRYCSNNCPYKVRRFNFFLYSDWYTKSLAGLRNPDVTVRSRGVMEKCTYCVQRISAKKIESEREDRKVKDGEIVPACAQTCPTQAITFGDLNDRDSRVSKLKTQPRNYGLLEELNTRPRTTYLSRVRNPNPDLERT